MKSERRSVLAGTGALLLLFTGGIPVVAAQESEPGGGFSRCNALNAPRHAAATALESRLARRSACLDMLAIAFDEEAESLADRDGDKLPTLYTVAQTASFVRASSSQLRAVANSSEATEDILRESYDALADAIVEAETLLNQLGDDAQLANVDLQNALQKQQQTLQMMSNISKMLYDTAAAVIRKYGG